MKRVVKASTDPFFKHLEDELWAAISKYAKKRFGANDTDWKDYTVVEVGFYDEDPTLVEAQVRSEFAVSFKAANDLSEYLDRVVERYDPDAYFDQLDAGILVAYLDKGILNIP